MWNVSLTGSTRRPIDDEKGLKVLDTGHGGLDFDTSVHFPGEVSISFLVSDLDAFVDSLDEKGVEPEEGPREAHMGMRAIVPHDPDGPRVAIQTPTDESPAWLRDMVR